MVSFVFIQAAVIFAVALLVLIKGADIFIDGAKKIGQWFGMSSFAVGILIVGMGTSLPELASSFAAVWSGATEIVIANAVGSNITNILLIVGVLAFFGGPVLIKQDLLKTELPLFFIATVHFIAVLIDGVVDRVEAVLLVATFGAYLWYIMVESKQQVMEDGEVVPKISWLTFALTVGGLAAVIFGATYVVESTITMATILSVPVGLVAILAIAIGTSLPEFVVTIQSIRRRETEMAIGNIFGSNAFNMLVVVGLPGLFVSALVADVVVMQLGLGILIAASLIFFVSGLARQLMRWEGLMMLIFFAFFLVKLLELL
jgi:cation:H+ antiporter